MTRSNSTGQAGKPFSSRLEVTNHRGVARARDVRDQAVKFLESINRGQTTFESELVSFRQLLKSAPGALGESTAELQDLAGVGPRYFEDLHKRKSRPSLDHMRRVLEAIIDTANERLLDVEGAHVARWIKNPLSPNSVEEVQQSLVEVVRYLRESNSLSQVSELDEHWRRSLISLCETTIKVLQAPEVELSLLAKCGSELKKFAAWIVPLAVGGVIGGVAGEAGKALVRIAIQPAAEISSCEIGEGVSRM